MIYDCFLYRNEKELLDIRLHEMLLCKDMVTHVLIEADVTHTGEEKQLYFQSYKKEFSRYPNIFHLVVDNMPIGESPRKMEEFQRNSIMKALKFLEPKFQDTVIISDVDEIPRAKMVDIFKPDMIFAALMQDKYAYYLNCLEERGTWDRARIMTWQYLQDKTPEEVRNSGFDIAIRNAGHHWSWLKDPARKLQSYSHQELNTTENIERVNRGENIWSDNKFEMIEIDLSHPEYLFNNQSKFSHLIK